MPTTSTGTVSSSSFNCVSQYALSQSSSSSSPSLLSSSSTKLRVCGHYQHRQHRLAKDSNDSQDAHNISSVVDQDVKMKLYQWTYSLEETLQNFQTVSANKFKLVFGDETLHEICAHYRCMLQRSCLEQPLSIEDYEQHSGLQLYTSIIEQINRLNALLAKCSATETLKVTKSSSLCNDGDQDEQKKCKDISLQAIRRSAALSHRQNWQFWFWKSDQRYPKWDYGLQKLAKPFSTVDQLMDILAQLIDIHQVVIPSDYSLFQEHIKPKWEDSNNKDGGSWMIDFDRSTTDASMIQAIWVRLLRFVLEQEPNNRQGITLCGLKINMRFRSYIISLWTPDFLDLENILTTGHVIQRIIADIVKAYRQEVPTGEGESGGGDVAGGGGGDIGDSPNQYDDHCPELFYRAHKVSQQNAFIKEQTKFGFGHTFFI